MPASAVKQAEPLLGARARAFSEPLRFADFPGRAGDSQPAARRAQPLAAPAASGEDAARVNRRDLADLDRDFDALMERYKLRIYNLALQLVGNEDEANDVLTETFVSAYRSRGSFRRGSAVFTWLYRIAHNHSINRINSLARGRKHAGPSLNDLAGEAAAEPGGGDLLESSLVADWSQSPEMLLEQGELRAKVHEAINSLPPEYKSVLILREMEELSYNEIAEVAGLSLEAVKTRILRARKMVQRKMAPYYSQE